MNEHARENRRLDIALACAFVLLYVWLRSWSGLWQYRWTGFLMGLAFALYAQRGRQASYKIAKRYDIPRRAYLLGVAVFIASGAATLRRFVLSGNSDDGFFAVVLFALAVREAFVYRWLSTKDNTERLTSEQKPRLNHG
jgi:hypothetical protein